MIVWRNETMTVRQFFMLPVQDLASLESTPKMYDVQAVHRRYHSDGFKQDEKKKESGEAVRPQDNQVDIDLLFKHIIAPHVTQKRLQELIEWLVLTHHSFSDSFTLVKRLIDLYKGQPPKDQEPANVKNASSGEEIKLRVLKCLLLWALCVREFDTDSGSLDILSSFLCNTMLCEHKTFVMECARRLLPLLVPMYSDVNSKTLKCSDVFNEFQLLLSPQFKQSEWSFTMEDVTSLAIEESLAQSREKRTRRTFVERDDASLSPRVKISSDASSPSDSPTISAIAPAAYEAGRNHTFAEHKTSRRMRFFRRFSLTPSQSKSLSVLNLTQILSSGSTSLESDGSVSESTTPRKSSRSDSMINVENSDMIPIFTHSVATAEDRLKTMTMLLNKLDEKESQVTEQHLALFWRSCVFSNTVEHNGTTCYDSFDAHVGVEAACKAFCIPPDAVIRIANNLVDCGALKGIPVPKIFSDSHNTFYFTASSMPSVAFGRHVGFFPPFIGEEPNSGIFYIHDIEPLELARQLTLKEHSLLRSIRLAELQSCQWNSRDIDMRERCCPAICSFTRHADKIKSWVSSEIMLSWTSWATTPMAMRVKTFTFFIELADACNSLHNFQGLFEIMTALTTSEASRREQVVAALSYKTRRMYDSLAKICNVSNNCANYRALMKDVQPPLVPFMNVILHDLMWIKENEKDIGHFSKTMMKVLGTSYSTFLHSKHSCYTLKRSVVLQDYLQNHLSTVDDDFMSRLDSLPK